ncbi:MAG: hypothetical protein AMJ62_14250 [Myxococcales bacterium SG8_38]|nr:MAG: hypothetical protein AMJ62_14250 [Myxococcales bacterium SG8_38]
MHAERERAQEAELEKQELADRLEKRQQAKQKAAEAAAASSHKPKPRQEKKPGCAPDDPLCGLPLD